MIFFKTQSNSWGRGGRSLLFISNLIMPAVNVVKARTTNMNHICSLSSSWRNWLNVGQSSPKLFLGALPSADFRLKYAEKWCLLHSLLLYLIMDYYVFSLISYLKDHKLKTVHFTWMILYIGLLWYLNISGFIALSIFVISLCFIST